MKRLFTTALLTIAVLAMQARAQDDFSSTRLDNAAGRLKRSTVDLVDRTSEDLRRSASNTRGDLEAAFLAHQLDAGAGLFRQLVQDKRRAAELRDAAVILTELARRAPANGPNGSLWRSAQTALNDISRELGDNNGGGGDGDGKTENRPVSGRVYWRGTVDDRVRLVIRERQIETQILGGRPFPDGTFSFTAALPTRTVTVEVNKTKGRGTVRVVQQPTRANDYTAVVEIADNDGGAKEYQLDIYWR
jgi:hypothetical protein